MKKPFETRTIEQAIETLIDYRGKTPPKTTSGVWLITAKVIKDGFIQNENKEFIAADFYDEWMRRGLPKQWDVLVTTEAPLGEVAQIRTPEKVALAQRVILLRSNPEVVHQGYLYQAMKSPFVQGELKARSSGTTVLGIKQSELWKVTIPWYPLATQRNIAGVLSAYDDLIENNTRRIAILEEMAQAIYREWFVNFRFPGHEKVKLINSPLGKIPEGWALTDIGHFEQQGLVDLQTGPFGTQLKASHYTEAGTPVINVRNIGYGTVRSDKLEFLPDEMVERLSVHVLKTGDIVFGRKGAVDRHVLVTRTEEGWIQGSDCLRLRSLCNAVSPYILTFAFREQRHHEWMLRQCSHGATMASLNQDVIRRIPFVVASPHICKEFTEFSSSVVRQVSVLHQQCENLRQTRDLLLPKLISGQLNVEELDIELGEPLVEAAT